MKKEYHYMSDDEFKYKLAKDIQESTFEFIFIFIGITIMCIPAMLMI